VAPIGNSRAEPAGGSLVFVIVGRARLISGLVLFAFVLTHLINHAAGIWSLGALASGQAMFFAFWHNPVGTTALYAALAVHLLIALRAIWARDSFRAMGPAEAVRLGLGLAIPLLLIDHAIATRYAWEKFGTHTDYVFVLFAMWVSAPLLALKQAVALLVAWVHGCIGITLWLRHRSWFEPARAWLLALAVMIPTASLAGFIAAGTEISGLAQDPGWRQRAIAERHPPDAAGGAAIGRLIDGGQLGFVLVVAGAFAARSARIAVERRTRGVALRYGGGRSVRATTGMTVLAASRMHGIPHASVCGGRGRCSTCRIRVGIGLDALPPPRPEEARVLRRIGAPPNVRLACQTPVIDGLEVVPLLPPHSAGPADAGAGPSYRYGRELDTAVLFADLRGFTRLAEGRLPYDVVFILNRYFAEMGAAVENAGGRVDKFIGDGVMALFGVDSDPATAARQALATARAMSRRLADLNVELAGDLAEPLRIGIGLHLGPAIVGEMGYGRTRGVTAIGDTVNTASRLEAMTKEHDVQLIVSQALADAAGVAMVDAPTLEIAIRGRSRPLAVRLIADAAALPAFPDSKT